MLARMFASVAMAKRIEKAESRLLRAGAEAIARRPGVDVYLRDLAGGVASHTIEGSPLNKVTGVGFDEPLAEEQLGELERDLFGRGAPVQIELSTLADPSIAPWLTGRGYRLVGFENVLGRSLTGLQQTSEGTSVELEPEGDAPRWLSTMVSGFLAPDVEGVPSHEVFTREVLEPVIADFASVAGMRRYLVRLDGEIAAAGSVCFTDGIAQLCGAATLPAYRRRGAQTALLERRLADAAESGCDIAVLTTQPGSRSMQNALRRGFVLLYARAVLVRQP